MRDRSTLKALRQMNEVQRVHRYATEAALGAANDAEKKAAHALFEARLDTAAAEQDWDDYLSSQSFSPLYAGHLAGRLMVRASAEIEAEGRKERAAQRRVRCESDWQSSQAKVRLGERAQQRLSRQVLRDIEEDRLAALADRTTWDWSHQ